MKFLKMTAMTLFMGVLSSYALAANFELTSPHIAEGEVLDTAQVFNNFGCTGKNISPALIWKNAPEGTKSFVVTVYDPDAPTGSGWWHWIVANIPADMTRLDAGLDNTGNNLNILQTRTDYGSVGYGGACPPPGEMHRYVFKVQALSVAKLEISENSSAALIGYLAGANSLAEATITAVYTRN